MLVVDREDDRARPCGREGVHVVGGNERGLGVPVSSRGGLFVGGDPYHRPGTRACWHQRGVT